jgi:hypothetical protein
MDPSSLPIGMGLSFPPAVSALRLELESKSDIITKRPAQITGGVLLVR